MTAVYVIGQVAHEYLPAMYMASTFPFENLPLSSFSVLLVMSVISAGLSAAFYIKSRRVRKDIPKDLTANIFSRTFNVFNPFPEHRRIFHSYLFFIFFSPLIAFVWTFILVFVVFMKVLEAGLLMELVTFLLSLGLLMVSEATEIYSTASTLLKAAKTKRRFGRGDTKILSIVKRSLSRMSTYYLLLSIAFICLFFTLPTVFPMIMLAFSHLVGATVGMTIGSSFVALFATILLYVLVVITTLFVGGKAKAAVFGFPPSSRPMSVWSTAGLKGMHDPFILASHIDDEDPDATT
jgi:hypothetical protein